MPYMPASPGQQQSSLAATATATARCIVWFRRDLRVEDNPALSAGVRTGEVIPVFVWAPEEEGPYYPGRVSRWWLSQSLHHLDASLRRLGASPLLYRRSPDSAAALIDLVHHTRATNVFFNHLYDPLSLVRDHRLKELLTARGINVSSFNADLLYEPWEVNDENGQPFSTFAPFWNKCLSMPYDPAAPLLPPKSICSGDVSTGLSDSTVSFEDESERGSNALLARAWSPGWRNADRALMAFLNGPLIDYSTNRKKADGSSTSLLSPHLHFGELSVRKVFHLVRMKQLVWTNEGNKAGEESCSLFLRSIGLREYSRYMSFNHPCSHERPLLAHLRFFPWVIDETLFKAWRQGRTGYPLVDAGMRELWATGWLHDRIRVVVSSFFVKVLQLPWRWGMKYFWDTLLDADLESDALGWQYISGSLPDGRELDRIDNPEFEGYKFDPHGEYVRRWLPELARLPTEWIHHPWDAPEPVLQAAGVELGSNYPLPIIDLETAKSRLQDALAVMWQQEAASRAALENGTEEGLGDSELPPIDFPEDMQMELIETDPEPGPRPIRVNMVGQVRRREDQMVPSMTSSLIRVEEDEEVSNVSNDNLVHNLGNNLGHNAEVPTNAGFVGVGVDRLGENRGAGGNNTVNNNNNAWRFVGEPTEASSSFTGRGSQGVVPVWDPPSMSSRSEEPEISSGVFIDRHTVQPRRIMDWRQLPPAVTRSWDMENAVQPNFIGSTQS
ncbi:Cryptochrome-1 [Rhynchospora pubera]|uniref:Cryptochrome-1 n=1 Tax=Rhynchospora pubera TaxID=906938 RepID=A0AAV8CAT9_9POAL|nr:Cryptochrome-1 [Rhynchospora pubera]